MNRIDITIFWTLIVLFIAIFLWLILALWLVYARKKELVECFSNSPCLKMWAPGKYGDPNSRLIHLGFVMGAMAFPRLHVSRGYVSEQDLENLPQTLRRILVWMRHTLVVIMTAFVLMFAGWQFGLFEFWGAIDFSTKKQFGTHFPESRNRSGLISD